MDTGRGHFEEISKELFDMNEEKFSPISGAFKVGEKLELKGSMFKVHAIRPKKLILKLLKKEV